MQIKIPQVVKDNAAWSIVTLIGFLFAFWVGNTFVMAEDHKTQHETEAQTVANKLDSLFQQLEYAQEKRSWDDKVKDIQNEIKAKNARIEELTLYKQYGSQANNAAREQVIMKLTNEKADLDTELTVLLADPPKVKSTDSQ